MATRSTNDENAPPSHGCENKRPQLTKSKISTSHLSAKSSHGVDLKLHTPSDKSSTRVRIGKTPRFVNGSYPSWNATSGRELRRWLLTSFFDPKYNNESKHIPATVMAMTAEKYTTADSSSKPSANAGAATESSDMSTLMLIRRKMSEFENWFQRRTPSPTTESEQRPRAVQVSWNAEVGRGADGTIGVLLRWSESEQAYVVSHTTQAAIVLCDSKISKGDVVLSLNGTELDQESDTAALLRSCGPSAKMELRPPTVPRADRSPVSSPRNNHDAKTLKLIQLSQDRDCQRNGSADAPRLRRSAPASSTTKAQTKPSSNRSKNNNADVSTRRSSGLRV